MSIRYAAWSKIRPKLQSPGKKYQQSSFFSIISRQTSHVSHSWRYWRSFGWSAFSLTFVFSNIFTLLFEWELSLLSEWATILAKPDCLWDRSAKWGPGFRSHLFWIYTYFNEQERQILETTAISIRSILPKFAYFFPKNECLPSLLKAHKVILKVIRSEW